jgi:misacylated tRNA(Ala) deacylase
VSATPTATLFLDDAYARSCTARVVAARPDGVVLDQTVAYAAGGGQPGDRGTLEVGVSVFRLADTLKAPESGLILHRLVPDADAFAPEAEVAVEIDWPRRHLLMRTHSAMHLLCAAVPGSVTGGQVGEGKGRLDFDLPDVAIDKAALEVQLNAWVADDRAISAEWIDDGEFDRRPELVRTLSVKPPRGQGRVRLVRIDGVDLQACGGTHVRATAEIGPLRVLKVENKGRHNRRVTIAVDDV